MFATGEVVIDDDRVAGGPTQGGNRMQRVSFGCAVRLLSVAPLPRQKAARRPRHHQLTVDLLHAAPDDGEEYCQKSKQAQTGKQAQKKDGDFNAQGIDLVRRPDLRRTV